MVSVRPAASAVKVSTQLRFERNGFAEKEQNIINNEYSEYLVKHSGLLASVECYTIITLLTRHSFYINNETKSVKQHFCVVIN